jgi:hypothetical protein
VAKEPFTLRLEPSVIEAIKKAAETDQVSPATWVADAIQMRLHEPAQKTPERVTDELIGRLKQVKAQKDARIVEGYTWNGEPIYADERGPMQRGGPKSSKTNRK